jgi:hypothetical protein
MTRWAVALCLIAAAALAVASGDEEGPAPRPPLLPRVIQDDRAFLHEPESLRSNLDEIKDLGFTHLRVTASWSSLAPEPAAKTRPAFDAADPAAYDRLADVSWEKLDRVVREASSRDIGALIDIGFWAPLWAAEPADEGGTENPRTNIDVREYADFARAVVRRYSGAYAPPGEDALPRVDMYSVWNEPNIPGFFEPQWQAGENGRVPASPHLYRSMVDAAYAAIKEVRPDTTVLVGGLAPRGSYDTAELAGGVPPLAFVRELACVDRQLEPLTRSGCERFRKVRGDGFSIHPYGFGTPPEESGRRDDVHIADLGRLIDLLRALARQGRVDQGLGELYITEFGYKTDPPDPKGVSAEEQLSYWLRSEEIAASHPEVRMFAQFLIRDSVCEGCLFWPTGYRYADGRAKPLMGGLGSTDSDG